ncbi:MAG: adenosine kinase [Planctomycetia bacterium]|nr:adenosine kinase [Planctomycetia bacterium]
MRSAGRACPPSSKGQSRRARPPYSDSGAAVAETRFDVLCIGNAIVDVLARVEDAFLPGHGLTKGMMRLIDEPTAEQLYGAMGPAIEVSGGSAGNTAAGIASFGGRTAYFGKVKKDQLGDVFAHDLRAQGVSFHSLPAKIGPATARSFILVTPDGERTMNTYLGACVNLTTADIDPEIVAGSLITYLEGYLWDRPEAKEAFQRAAQIAREAGRKTAITLSDSFCVDRHRESFLELIRNKIDIMFANESEICSLYQTPDFDAARELARADCEIAVLTRSEQGSVIVRGEKTWTVPAHPIPKLVDATGAGDLFAAGFLHGLTAGRPLDHCARLGALAAAEVITHLGARPEVKLAEHAKIAGLL